MKLLNLTAARFLAESGAKVASSEGIFDSNTAKAAGGAIYLNNSELEDSGSKFSNNTALNGGALYIDETSSATIKDSSFSSNLAKGTDAKGGAIYNAGTLTLTADAGDIDFSGNKAADKINDIYTTGSITINGAKM